MAKDKNIKTFEALIEDISSESYQNRDLKFTHDADSCCDFELGKTYDYPKINSANCSELLKAIKNNRYIFMLCLCCNQINDSVLSELSELDNLFELHAATNEFTAIGAGKIISVITLLALDISNNKIASKSNFDTLLNNKNLLYLKIDLCGFSPKEEKLIQAKILQNREKWTQEKLDSFYKLLILSADHSNPESKSFWHEYPLEIKRKIFNLISYDSTDFYKIENAFKKMSGFLLLNSQKISESFSCKNGVKIFSDLDNQFSFFRKENKEYLNKFDAVFLPEFKPFLHYSSD